MSYLTITAIDLHTPQKACARRLLVHRLLVVRYKLSIETFQLSNSFDELTRRYLAHIHAFAYGLRHIVESVGEPVEVVAMCGGLAENAL